MGVTDGSKFLLLRIVVAFHGNMEHVEKGPGVDEPSGQFASTQAEVDHFFMWRQAGRVGWSVFKYIRDGIIGCVW